MFKVEIKNLLGEVTHSAEFSTEAEGIAWSSENENAFGLDFVAVHTDVTEHKAIEKQKAEALKYLASTDWCVIRFIETQVVIPSEVLTKRAAARVVLSPVNVVE